MRICFIGGPCSGKSKTAAWIFSELKERKISVEHVTEYVKSWTYIRRNVKEFDQIYIFAKQQQMEYKFLSNGVKNIITDSLHYYLYFIQIYIFLKKWVMLFGNYVKYMIQNIQPYIHSSVSLFSSIILNINAFLRKPNEKTGDWFLGNSRLQAAKYFANKKRISLKDWLKIYYIPK